jgi:hypothetical protein
MERKGDLGDILTVMKMYHNEIGRRKASAKTSIDGACDGKGPPDSL